MRNLGEVVGVTAHSEHPTCGPAANICDGHLGGSSVRYRTDNGYDVRHMLRSAATADQSTVTVAAAAAGAITSPVLVGAVATTPAPVVTNLPYLQPSGSRFHGVSDRLRSTSHLLHPPNSHPNPSRRLLRCQKKTTRVMLVTSDHGIR